MFMGLKNKYVGEIKFIGNSPEIFSPDWCHREANSMTLALSEDEAQVLSRALQNKAKAQTAADDFRRALEREVCGRELESDEKEFLEQEPCCAVLDV